MITQGDENLSEMNLDEAVRLYGDFVKKIADRFETVRQYLQNKGLNPSSIDDSMNWMVEKWKNGRKVCRALKIIPLFKIITGMELPKPLKTCLLSLDAKINFLDEFIDNKNLDKKEKVDMAIVSVFNDLGITLGFLLKPEKIQDLTNALFEYLLFLSQIPSVEWQTYEKIMKTTKVQEEIQYAVKSYHYLSNDTSVFFDIPVIILELSRNKVEPTKTQILVCRSLELVSKDIRDLMHDLREEAKTPATAFFRKYGNESMVLEKLRKIREQMISDSDWRNENGIEKYVAELVLKTEI